MKKKMPVYSKELVQYYNSRTSKRYKYHIAFQWIEKQIFLGRKTKEIVEEFSCLHSTDPSVYSIRGGNPLSTGVYYRFRKAVYQKFIKDTFIQNRSSKLRDKAQQQINDWKNVSPAYKLVKERLETGASYNDILAEIESFPEEKRKQYVTRTGSPITKSIMSLWAKQYGFKVQPTSVQRKFC